MAKGAPHTAARRTAFRLGHRPVLDGVRAVAVLAVVGLHFFDSPRGGFLGVDIFFVLSGFLITSILLEERAHCGSFSFRAFYIRRALRLFPALAVVAAAFLLYAVTIAPASLLRDNLIVTAATLTYWTNFLYAHGLFAVQETGLQHAWSLAIEEQFYIVWPVVLATALLLGRTRAALAVALCGIGAVMAWRLVRMSGLEDGFPRVYYGFDARADSLLVGCVLALVLTDARWLAGVRRLVLRVTLVPAVALVALSLVFAEIVGRILYLGGFTIFAVATAVILYNLVTWRPPLLASVLEWGPMVYVGRISYGLYLWHWPIFVLLRDELPRAWMTLAVGLPLTFLVAAASFRWVEQPFLRYKKRFERRSAERVESSPEGLRHVRTTPTGRPMRSGGLGRPAAASSPPLPSGR